MKRLSLVARRALVALLSSAALLAFAQAQGPTPAKLELLVTDTADAPIAGARVALNPNIGGREIQLGRANTVGGITDVAGRLSLTLREAGSYTVRASREGYLDPDSLVGTEHVEQVNVEPGKSTQMSVALVRGASLEGTVFREDGKRVANASLRLQSTAENGSRAALGAALWLAAKTDANGRYRFPLVPPGEYGMWIAPPPDVYLPSLEKHSDGQWTGFGASRWHPSIEEERRVIAVRMRAGETLTGYNAVLRASRVYRYSAQLVSATSRRLLTTASVALWSAGETPVMIVEPRGVDRKTAAFEMPPLAAAEYTLLVYRRDTGGQLPWATTIEPASTKETPAPIFVPEWITVGGKATAVDPEADKQPNLTMNRPRLPYSSTLTAEVHLIPLDTIGEPVRVLIARGQGLDTVTGIAEFRSEPVPPGRYALNYVVPDGWYVARAMAGIATDIWQHPEIEVSSRIDDLALEFQQGGAVAEGALVHANGTAVTNGIVCIVADDAARRRQPGGAACRHNASDATYTSQWLSPGTWKFYGFLKRPQERPESDEFAARYDAQAKRIEVKADTQRLRVHLAAIE